MMPDPFKKYADDYSDQNLSIFPCGKKGGKLPLVRWAKYQYELAGLSTLEKWRNGFPKANIGLITGRLSGVTVVDCDDPSRSIEDLQKEYGEAFFIVETPRGGKHLYYRHNGEGSKNKFADNIDLKSEGGYVIGPFSINPENGKQYKIIKGSFDNLSSLTKSTHPNLPKKYKTHTTSKETVSCKPSKEAGSNKVTEGNRNSYLFSKLKQEAQIICSYEDINKRAHEINETELYPVLPKDEVNSVAKKISDYKRDGRLFNRGDKKIVCDHSIYDALCKDPWALNLYLLLLKNNSVRSTFTIIQDGVGFILGCDRRRISKAIEVLIEKSLIKRVHESTGKNDGHRYQFC